MRNRRHRISRLLATALALFAIVGQVSSFAHLVLVQHVTCAEHGELIEVAGGEARAATVPAHRQTSDAVAADTSTETHGHDHCLVAPMRRDRALIGTPTALDCTHVDAYGTVGRVAISEIPPAIAILSLAPKNSPPVA